MTREEAIEWIESLVETMLHETSVGPFPDPEYSDEVYEALDMAIRALEQEPTTKDNSEVIAMLELLKAQAHNSGANTFIWDVTLESFNFVITRAIESLAQEPTTKNDVVPRKVVERIIKSPRTQEQMLSMLNSIQSVTPQEPCDKCEVGMTIDEARTALGKERKYALHENKQAFDIAIDTMKKYQMMELDYKARLRADMVAMLEDLNLEIDEMFARRIDYTVDKIQDLIQDKINALRGENNG